MTQINFISSISATDPNHWDSMVPNNYPFLKHAFLDALEKHHVTTENSGWIPHHLAGFDGNRLIGAMPLYIKTNSWGEFVFDHGWAEAFARHGLQYYPKLVNAIPFTPATGPRIIAFKDHTDIKPSLLNSALDLLKEGTYSGFHCLFPDQSTFKIGQHTDGALIRNDCQFHWHNENFTTFEDFLSQLKSKKRKNIIAERRAINTYPITIQTMDGNEISEHMWQEFTALYQTIYDRKYGAPAFNSDFFIAVAAAIPDQIHLIAAFYEQRMIAGALFYSDDDTLYGRHWGVQTPIRNLHFELCYYRGIELCLDKKLKHFNPGAQGEHKIAKGFLPTHTRSFHIMSPSPFTDALENFVEQEKQQVFYYMDSCQQHSPYAQKP